MIRYPDDYNPILEYWEEIKSGKKAACKKLRRTYKKLASDCLRTDWEYRYSPARANHFIEFCENYCRHSKGRLAGQKVKLELWEKAFGAAAFGFVDRRGLRKYREVILMVAKKNGKSLLASCIGLYLQVADGEGGPEVYSVATKKDQAKIIWGEAKRMVNKSPSLKKRIQPRVAEMRSDFNDGVFKPLGADADTLDGLNVHGVLMDEVHQWKSGKALYDIMVDGTINRDQPMIVVTTTAGTVREDICDDIYDRCDRLIRGYDDPNGYQNEHMLAIIYELDRREEWMDESCWEKANPGLGTIKPIGALRNKVRDAMQNPSQVKNLVCKDFNVPETAAEAWLSFDQLNNTAVYDIGTMNLRYGIGGADLSRTTDLTAAKVIFRQSEEDPVIYVLSMYWMPEELVEKRVKEDHIPYDIWIQKGFMRTCPGNSNHPKYVTEWFVEVQETLGLYIPWVGYDSWSAKYWVEEMAGYFGPNAMVPVIQGKKTLSGPMHQLGADLEAKLVNYNNNPIDKWCLANTSVDKDVNGNIQPKKTSSRTKRIDGTAALLDAFTVYLDKQEEYMSMV